MRPCLQIGGMLRRGDLSRKNCCWSLRFPAAIAARPRPLNFDDSSVAQPAGMCRDAGAEGLECSPGPELWTIVRPTDW